MGDTNTTDSTESLTSAMRFNVGLLVAFLGILVAFAPLIVEVPSLFGVLPMTVIPSLMLISLGGACAVGSII